MRLRFLPALPALLALLAAGSAWAQPEDTPMTIICMGDSTTAGTPGFRSPAEAPPAGEGNEESQWTYWAGRQLPNLVFLNRGVNAERTEQIFKRLKTELRGTEPPRAVVLLAGVNDIYQSYPVEHIQDNLEKIFQFARSEGVPLMACTILPYNTISDYNLRRLKEVNAWIRKRTLELGLAYCDLYSEMDNPDRPGTLISSADGIHPDVKGYRRMGEAVAECLRSTVVSFESR